MGVAWEKREKLIGFYLVSGFKEEFFLSSFETKGKSYVQTPSIGSINWDDKEVSEQNSIFILCSFHIHH